VSDDAITDAITEAVATLPADEADSSEPTGTDTPDAPDTGAETPDTGAETPDTGAETPEGEKPDPSEDDELAGIEQELVSKTPGLRGGRIAVSRHQAVLTRARRKHEAELQELQQQLKPLQSQETQAQLAMLRIAERDMDSYVNKVLIKDERFGRVLNGLVERELQKRGAVPKGQAEAATPEKMPEPDRLNSDGTPGYSAEQTQKVVEWRLRQAQQETAKEIAALREALNPLQEERAYNQRLSQANQRVTSLLEDARQNWTGFTDHESAIREELAKPGNETMRLHEAYVRVVPKRLVTNEEQLRTKIRADLLKEMQGKKGTRVAAPGSLPAVTADSDGEPRDTADVIREAVASAGLK
jgi:hypothetical protein